MKRIIALLTEKNHYLEKFYSLNEAELENFVRGQFEGLDYFYATREKILEIIRYIDQKIDAVGLNQAEVQTTLTTDLRKNFNECLHIKDQYAHRILEQDLKILACIESAKNEIIRELQDVKKTKRAVMGYKSPVFKKQIDEEI